MQRVQSQRVVSINLLAQTPFVLTTIIWGRGQQQFMRFMSCTAPRLIIDQRLSNGSYLLSVISSVMAGGLTLLVLTGGEKPLAAIFTREVFGQYCFVAEL